MCDLTTSPRLIRCAYRIKKVLRKNTELAEEIDASSRHLISQITKSIQCPMFGSPDPPASKKELDEELKSELKELIEDLVTNSIKKILPNQLSEALDSIISPNSLRDSQLQNALNLRAPNAPDAPDAPQYYSQPTASTVAIPSGSTNNARISQSWW
ncbi:hypothetical protein HYALB_00010488 [Hymenoscyphus albidus]|uniref:Uncharacterized protein n=1 Tax=Hymenoscyphus albidus TaxID=595503 RepID=A0A9N9Q9F8_9HELO|nr:hypothetical protein HYALB_00010488 [Hymenoscyphus albidus]